MSQSLGNPVYSLQTMLRSLSSLHDFIPPVPLDGIFGTETLEAVLQFQKELFPPATGVVNQDVWDALQQELTPHKENLEKPRVLRAYPEEGDPLEFGEERGEIALFQLMFQLLSTSLVGIAYDPPSGNFTEALQLNVIWLQEISGLPITGQLDQQTWDRLARLYELFVTKV